MSSLAGLANSAILFIINSIAAKASHGNLQFKYLMLFVVSFLIFFIGKNYSLTHSSIIIEKILAKLRLRILDKARNSDLTVIENIGLAKVHTKLTHNANAISETALMAVVVCQYSIMVILCSLYIAWLSMPAFLCSTGLITLAYIYFNGKRKEAYAFLKQSTLVQEKFFKKINGIFQGFKELKVNRNRNDDHFKDVAKISEESEHLMIQTQLKFVSGMIIAEIAFYALLATVVFVLPQIGNPASGLITKLVTSILFVMGPMITIVSAMPMLTRANIAIAEIYELEQQFDKATSSENNAPVRKIDFQEISLENIIFNYKDRHENIIFTLDNINFNIKKGELIFIVGGNGSGKSTVLKILTGLYFPDSGNIRLNGKLINQSNYQSFRELFSIIFTDFHLFDKLYGLDIIDEGKIQYYLEKMELEDKTTFENNGFTNLKLSTGQMKRLAMIIALLFDSQIYIFDELAADQSPDFRKYFYEILLKELQKKGKTIIVVSHDDRFFHVADRVIKMNYGKFTKE